MKREAAKLGRGIAQVMTILLKDQIENCAATICIESDNINNNDDIQEVATTMKTILWKWSIFP